MDTAEDIQTDRGYALDELRQFLDAARARIDELVAEVADARELVEGTETREDEAEIRRQVASTWAEAHREAERIRAEADREAVALVEEARQAAREMRGVAPVAAGQSAEAPVPPGDERAPHS